MEREKLVGQSNPAQPDQDDALTLGDLVAHVVAELGADRAMLWGGYANLGEDTAPRGVLPLPALDVQKRARGVCVADDHADALASATTSLIVEASI